MLKSYLYQLLSIKQINRKLNPEAKIQYEFVNCLRALSLENKLDAVWFAVSNETGRSDHASFGQLQKMLGKIPGTPDMVFLWNGGAGFIEFKSTKGRLSPNQKNFQQWCEDQRVDYRICFAKSEALAVLLEWGIINDLHYKISPW